MSESTTSSQPKRTPLYERHVALGAKVIDFGGWAMPVQYSGILDEHKTVREAVGLFDVSHMGEIFFDGPEAKRAVQNLVTNDVMRLGNGDALYTCSLREHGGIVDDCIVYRTSETHFLIIVNASNIEKDYAHFVEQTAKLGANVTLTNRSDDYALLAVQGPRAMGLVAELANGVVPHKGFTFVETTIAGHLVQIARTGYTAEDGVEICVPATGAVALWDLILERGASFGIKPIGLGARDTLRLEGKLSLYGNDIDEDHNPIEAGLGWVVKGKGYVGEAAIEKIKAAGVTRKLVGFKVLGRGIARHGYPIHALVGPAEGGQMGDRVGEVTSGTVAPTVGGAIGIGYVPSALAEPGTLLIADCRGKGAVIEVVKGPFYKRPSQG